MLSAAFWKNLFSRTLVIPILFLSLASAQNQNISRSGLDQERLARISVRMNSFVEPGAMAGAVMLVAQHGEVAYLKAVGYRDLESRKPMRSDTIFDIRSVTKPITAIGIMILMDEGRLALNDPVEKYLPEFKTTRRTQGSSEPKP